MSKVATVSKGTLVLASASPRRVALLKQVGLPFEQIVSPAPEPAPEGEAVEHAIHSARTKAEAVSENLPRDRGTFVVGADTVVWLEDKLLGKPTSVDDAARMLGLLSGRQHSVCTGLCVLSPDGVAHEAAEVTRVHMTPLSESAITDYIESGEPLDKAGSYGIQGLGARFIERIEGCYYNVVGLPLHRLTTLLAAAGFDVDTPFKPDRA